MGILGYEEVKVLLLDIEGTTTPIDFVHTTLFKYASDNVEGFLTRNLEFLEIKELVASLHEQQKMDLKDGLAPPDWPESKDAEVENASRYCKWLISRDSKFGALKSLQGKIWEEGFKSGSLNGEVYDDVPKALDRWSRQGRKICIYSSGSALAQKLIFSTTRQGDLSRYITDFFDTSVGHKREDESYTNISKRLRVPSENILFLSDVAEELDAAEKAGMKTTLLKRKGNAEQPENEHNVVEDFNSLFPD